MLRKKKLAQKSIPTIEHFYVAVLLPPETPSQTTLLHAVRSIPNGYMTIDQKAYIVTQNPTDKKIVLLVECEMLMRTTRLKPKYEGLQFWKELSICPIEERKANIRITPEFDYDSMEFEGWLNKKGLLKNIVIYTDDLNFARKAYLVIARDFTFWTTCEPKASQIIATGKADNLGMNKVLVTALRANKIPARLMYRRIPKKERSGAITV